jgi:hypothetical protein
VAGTIKGGYHLALWAWAKRANVATSSATH